MLARKCYILLIIFVLSSTHLSAQCTGVKVEVDQSTSCTPGIFQFVAKGLPPAAVVEWDFGNGPVTGSDTFNKIVADPGFVDLTLFVYAAGKQCSTSYKSIANVLPRPEPKLKLSKKELCGTDDTVTLTDITPKSAFRIWNIEGLNFADTLVSRKTKFTSSGKKSITLVVEDSFGCRGAKTFTNVADVAAQPQMDVSGGGVVICQNTSATFSPLLTIPVTDITSIRWNLPNASNFDSTQLNLKNVRYYQTGSHPGGYTIVDKKGCSYTHLSSKLVEVKDTIELHSQIWDTLFCLPKDILMQVTDTGLQGDLRWSVSTSPVYDSFSKTVRRYYFVNPGEYDLYLEYEDDFCISRHYRPKFAVGKKVTSHFSATDYYDCEVPFTAKFKNLSTSSDTGQLSYVWTLFDTMGTVITTSVNKDFSYTVDSFNYFDVELKVTSTNGCSDVLNKERFIRADSIRIDYIPIPKEVCLNQEVHIYNRSQESSYRTSGDRFQWWLYKHGDTTLAIDSSTVDNPDFIATYDGKYDIKVRAWNSVGCEQVQFRDSVFKVVKPVPDFDMRSDTTCVESPLSTDIKNKPETAEYQHQWYAINGTDTIDLGRNQQPKTPDKPGLYDISYALAIDGFCHDTIVRTSALALSGVEANVVLASKLTCVGEKLKPTVQVTNTVFGPTSTNLDYEWSVVPARATIIDGDKASPEITFTENGKYRIRVTVKNARGCVDTAWSETVTVGLDYSYYFKDTAACANTPIDIILRADTLVNRWYYNLSPNNKHTVLGLGKDTVSLYIEDEGSYTFELYASRDSLCFDTIKQSVQIVSPSAEFTYLDSGLYCAPVYERFRANGANVDTFFWDFGDGKTLKTTFDKVTTLYEENTGSLNPYTVQLIAKNKSGCADTVTKPNLIKVDGPAVEFTLDTNRGCEPFELAMTGRTENVWKMFIDYGDGIGFGYSLNQTHTYANTWKIIEQEYEPLILVVDSNGCQTVVKSDSSVFVKPSPIARIGLPDSIGCAPFSTQYYYLGEGAKTWEWDFNGDGFTDRTGGSGLWKFNTPGRYTMTVINHNDFGCSDTAAHFVHAVQPPEAKIGLESTSLCLNQLTTLRDSSVYDTTKASINWAFSQGANQWSSQDSLVQLLLTNQGDVNILLEVTDSMGCKGSDQRVLRVVQPQNTEPATLEFVSVRDNAMVEVIPTIPTLPYVNSFLLRQDPATGLNLVKSFQPGSSLVRDTMNSVTESYCYRTYHEDSCGSSSDSSNLHCTVFLQTSSTIHGKNELSWTPYIGWTNVKEYRVLRLLNNGLRQVIANLPASQTSFTDSLLCDSVYCYLIGAVHPGKSIESFSNSACQRPIFNPVQLTTEVKRVTVVDDSYIEINAEDTTGISYTFIKQINGNVVDQMVTNEPHFNDYNVEVDDKSYTYLVTSTDRCGITSTAGNIGKSMVLDLSKDDRLHFRWTAYREWDGGVSDYVLFRKQGDNFLAYKTQIGTDTTMDVEISSEIETSNCFKVVAFGHGGAVESHSNVVCLESEPMIFIPNAFSPYSDHGNDDFKPIALFIRSPEDYDNGIYEFQIFNRWGEMVYESNNPEQGWKGDYKNKPAMAGAYFYWFRVRGLDQRVRTYSGTVNLIR